MEKEEKEELKYKGERIEQEGKEEEDEGGGQTN